MSKTATVVLQNGLPEWLVERMSDICQCPERNATYIVHVDPIGNRWGLKACVTCGKDPGPTKRGSK